MNPLVKKGFLAAVMGVSVSAFADTGKEIAELRERLAALEEKQEAGNKEVNKFGDRISFSGAIEVEASYTDSDSFSGHRSSDLSLATVDFGIEADIAEDISTQLTLLYEDDGDNALDIDIATICFAEVMGTDILLGQNYVPFGVFETRLINDTLVLELAEARETTAMVTYGAGMFSASAYVFNGDVDDDNNVENYGLSLNLGDESISVGIDYISNIAETDGMQDILENSGYDPLVKDGDTSPSALIARGVATFANAALIAEYFQAEKIDAADWGVTSDFKPAAWQLELNWGWEEWVLGAAYQQTKELAGSLPERRLSVGVSKRIAKHITVALELWQDKDYRVNNGGTGDDANNAVLQVAVGF